MDKIKDLKFYLLLAFLGVLLIILLNWLVPSPIF